MSPHRATAGGPVLFVTGHAPADRIGAFATLSEREGVEFALFGGRLQHGVPAEGGRTAGGAAGEAAAEGRPELPFPHRFVSQAELARVVARGGHRAVILSTGGRLALPGAWGAARARGIPVILWSSLWAHPRSAGHAFSRLALARLYRSADAVVTYGPHVSDYVRARGARRIHEAPQAVDNGFWAAPATGEPSPPSWPQEASAKFLFVGRPVREKGSRVLIEAWRSSGLRAPAAALVLAGGRLNPPWVSVGGAAAVSEEASATGIVCRDAVNPGELRNLYALADVLVMPSIATRTFREPWGLVANEAMNQGLPIIASDAVGAVAGGLVRDGRNGLVFSSGDSQALARALRRLAEVPELRASLGEVGREDVAAYTYEAWAGGFSEALAEMNLSWSTASVD